MHELIIDQEPETLQFHDNAFMQMERLRFRWVKRQQNQLMTI